MTRSIRELVAAAEAQRRGAERSGRDLESEQFEVTEQEREELRYTPLTVEMSAHISAERDRVCGLPVVLAGSRGSPPRHRR